MMLEEVILHTAHVLLLRLRGLVGHLVGHSRYTLCHDARLLSHERIGAVLKVLSAHITHVVEI